MVWQPRLAKLMSGIVKDFKLDFAIFIWVSEAIGGQATLESEDPKPCLSQCWNELHEAFTGQVLTQTMVRLMQDPQSRHQPDSNVEEQLNKVYPVIIEALKAQAELNEAALFSEPEESDDERS